MDFAVYLRCISVPMNFSFRRAWRILFRSWPFTIITLIPFSTAEIISFIFAGIVPVTSVAILVSEKVLISFFNCWRFIFSINFVFAEAFGSEMYNPSTSTANTIFSAFSKIASFLIN